MLRLFFLAILVVLLAGVVLFGLSDAVISIGDISVPNSEVTSNAGNGSNCSATATIIITMTGVLNE